MTSSVYNSYHCHSYHEICGICLEPLIFSDTVAHAGEGKKHPLHRICAQTQALIKDECPSCRTKIGTDSLFSLKEKCIKELKSELKNIGTDALNGSLYSLGATGTSRLLIYAQSGLQSVGLDFLWNYGILTDLNMINIQGGANVNVATNFYGAAIGCLAGALVSNGSSSIEGSALAIAICAGNVLFRLGTSKLTEKVLDHSRLREMSEETKGSIKKKQESATKWSAIMITTSVLNNVAKISNTVSNMTLATGAIAGGAAGSMLTGFIQRRWRKAT